MFSNPANTVNGVVAAADRGLSEKPRLLIFDDDADFLALAVRLYERKGFNAVGALVHGPDSYIDVADNGTVSSSLCPTITRGIRDEKQLAALLEDFKPDAVLSDGDLKSDVFIKNGPQQVAGGMCLIDTVKKRQSTSPALRGLPPIACMIHTGSLAASESVQQEYGYAMAAKAGNPQLIADHINAQLAKNRGMALGG